MLFRTIDEQGYVSLATTVMNTVWGGFAILSSWTAQYVLRCRYCDRVVLLDETAKL